MLKGKVMRIALVLLLFAVLVWVGFRIQPPNFASLALSPLAGDIPARSMAIPAGLPSPVERFYRTLYGDSVPVIETAVVDGRARLKPFGFFMPGRFRFIYDAGNAYRHYIETTFLGIPLLRVNEAWVEGRSRFRIPIVGASENQPNENDSANLGLWAEMAFMPSVLLTDTRVRWLPVDEQTAILEVPFVPADAPQSVQRFVARFDPESGLLRYLETMRYRDAASAERVLWITEIHGYEEHGSSGFGPVARSGSATWFDQGSPWAIFEPERYQVNVEVNDMLHREGAE